MRNFIYLHPYVYIDSVEDGSIMINTLDGYTKTFEKGIVDNLIRKMNQNNFVSELSDNDILNKDIIRFIEELKDNYLGNSIETDNTLPIQLKPNPRLIGNNENNIENLGVDDSGENLLDYIHQINLHINSLNHKNEGYNNVYKQVDFPKVENSSAFLNIEDIQYILSKFRKIDIVYKIICGDFISIEYFTELRKIILKENRSVNFVFYYKTIIENLEFFESFNLTDKINYEIWFDNFYEYNIYEKIVNSKLNLENIQFHALIVKEDEVEELEKLGKSFLQLAFEIHPIYNGVNFELFEENVFSDIEDLIEQKNSLLNIQQKNVLNSLLFGNLHILSNGDTYSNLNFEKLGNIASDPIGDMLIKEFKDVKAWFTIRLNLLPCKDCVYRLLCPPVTNYELLKQKFNFCKINITDHEN